MRAGAGQHFLTETGVRAAVAIERCLDSRQFAVTCCASAYANDRGMPLWMNQQAFLARIQHLDRALRFFGEQCRMNLTCDVFLATKAATHECRHDAYRIRLKAQGCGNLVTVSVGNLTADINRRLVVPGSFTSCCGSVTYAAKLLGAITGRHTDRAFGFEEHMLRRRRSVGLVNDRVGFGKPGSNIALVDLYMFKQIALGSAFMHEWGIRFRGLNRVADDGQFLIVDRDQVQRCCGDFFAVGSNYSDGIAGITDLVRAQHRPVGDKDTVQVSARNVFVCQDSVDARQVARRTCVD